MAYADRYTAEFWDFNGEAIEIKIKKKDYAGASESLNGVLTDRPLTISMPPKSDLTDDFVMGMGCRLRLHNTGDFQKYDELFGTGDREFMIVITKNGTLIFEGFVIPSIYNQKIKYQPVVVIPANNKLADLTRYESPLLDPLTTGNFSRIILWDLIKDILNSTDLQKSVAIKNTLYSKLKTIAYDVSQPLIKYLYVNRQVFIDRDVPYNGREILSAILSIINSRLYYNKGIWHIDRLRDLRETDQYRVINQDATEATQTILHDNFELADSNITADSGDLEYSEGRKKIRLIIEFDKYDNLADPSFIHLQQSMVLLRTTKGRLPKPMVGLWQTWSGLEAYNKTLVSENINLGIAHSNGTLTTDEYYNVPVTTAVIVDFSTQFSMRIDYVYDWSLIAAVSNRNYRGGYRIRYEDNDGNWRFLTFVDGQLKLNSKMSDHSRYHELNERNWWLQWSRPTGTTVHRWRIINGVNNDILFQSTDFKSDSDPNLDAIYGSITFTGISTTAQFTTTINYPATDDYSRIPGRPEWSIDDVNADERPAGIYKYTGYAFSSVFFDMIPLQTIHKITGGVAQDNPGQNIKNTVSFEQIGTWVTNDLGYMPETLILYIDLMPMHRIDTPESESQWTPTLGNYTYMGDVLIQQNSNISNNVIEGILNTDFQEELEKRLRIYDGEFVNYKNTLLLRDSSSKIVRSRDWSDAYTDHQRKLQDILIHDWAQQYNKPRNTIVVELNIRDTKLITPGSVFTYTTPLGTKKFIVLGYEYEVRMSKWIVTLAEHEDNDNFVIS